MTDSALAAQLFLQLACILLACRMVGQFAARVGQPRVIAEMLTGFVLGPSVFGWLWPDAHALIFPAGSLSAIYILSQVGLALYMFCVGLEFRVDLLAGLGRRAIAVSVAGIAGPFLLGGALALPLQRAGGFFPEAVLPVEAALFMGAAMSITAFPVLARIIRERGITGTAVGALALSAGAIGDAAAWMVLAGVLGSLSGQASVAVLTVAGAVGFGLFVVLGLRPLLLQRLTAQTAQHERVSSVTFLVMLALLMLSAWFTERIGVHGVFGAFLLGASVPRGLLTAELRRMIEPLTTALLVPLFFVYAGLHTQLAILDSTGLWLTTALVFITACGGKGIFCWLAARLTGASTREALAVATLMNARGMVELILLNIGLSRGLITPTLYTMLVIMAIATSVMTGPLFSVVWHRGRQGDVADDRLAASGLL
jgi:Kef-type K+ transport system membrane component KefB